MVSYLWMNNPNLVPSVWLTTCLEVCMWIMYIYTHIFVYTYFRKTQLAILGVASSLFTSETRKSLKSKPLDVWGFEPATLHKQQHFTASPWRWPVGSRGKKCMGRFTDFSDDDGPYDSLEVLFFFGWQFGGIFVRWANCFFVGQGSLLRLKVYCKYRWSKQFLHC